jgi:preprotein translocase subunit SecD
MKSSWWLKFSFFIFLLVASVAMVIPTAFNLNKDSWFPVKSKINLGLDLQGGLYMIMGIDFNRVYRDEVMIYLKRAQQYLKDQGHLVELGKVNLKDPKDPHQQLVILPGQDKNVIREKIKTNFASLIRLTGEDDNYLEYGIHSGVKNVIETQSVTKSIEVIRNRIDEFGVTEPEITSQGDDRIVIQLPGVKDIERAKSLIGKTAKLEFRLVNDEKPLSSLIELVKKAHDAGIKFQAGEQFSTYLYKLNEFLSKDLPQGYEITFQRTRRGQVNMGGDGSSGDEANKAKVNVGGEDDAPEERMPYLVEMVPSLSGEDLEDANVQINQEKNEPYVSMNFNNMGAKKFENVTASNVGKRLAVILDGNVYTAPVIQQRIGGGNAQITLGYGDFNQLLNQAKDIALVLRAGALPVQLDFEEQRVVGPSLGQDSIDSAVRAAFISCLFLFISTIIYYRFSGFIAVVTLLLNVIFSLACLISFEATLTLPGIAGIALTVGMAVDANILIYERIREEIRRGVNGLKAVQLGFENAFWTILDANVTTAMAGFCLLNFGTGPVRGFAVTLLIGIFVTVYTAYFVSKILFEIYMKRTDGKSVSV